MGPFCKHIRDYELLDVPFEQFLLLYSLSKGEKLEQFWIEMGSSD